MQSSVVDGGDILPWKAAAATQVLARNAASFPVKSGISLAMFSSSVPQQNVESPGTFARLNGGVKPVFGRKRRNKDATGSSRVRFWRSTLPRFSHFRLKTSRSRPPTSDTAPTNARRSRPLRFPSFIGQKGSVDPVTWDSAFTDAALDKLDAACATRKEPSPSRFIRHHLTNMAQGEDLQYVWDSYVLLSHLQYKQPHLFPFRFPRTLLQRLCHFIIRSRPITSSHFPSLVKVMGRLWDMGIKPTRPQWNALINLAPGRDRVGQRSAFYRSIAVTSDFVHDRRPGSSIDGRNIDILTLLDPTLPNRPDIYTLTTLIHIASKSLDDDLFQKAIFLLEKSGLTPTRITRLSQLNFYAVKQRLNNFRATLREMHEDGMELNIDGVNVCIWAYARMKKYEMTLKIYRVLRHNIRPDPDRKTIAELHRSLRHKEIHISPDVKPDQATYVTLIQAMSFQGNFSRAASIFADFLESTPRGRLDPSTAPAFRAVFRGFSRHATSRLQLSIHPKHPKCKWNLSNLQRYHRLFLKLPRGVVPTETILHDIMVAYDKTSDHDIRLLRDVWKELEDRFLPSNRSLFNHARLRRIKDILFPKEGGGHG
ncbi:hypothetical protein MD484_g3953, partial [Candolleomyces efflorescens]